MRVMLQGVCPLTGLRFWKVFYHDAVSNFVFPKIPMGSGVHITLCVFFTPFIKINRDPVVYFFLCNVP